MSIINEGKTINKKNVRRSYLGIATLKANVLDIFDDENISCLNSSNELIRYLLSIRNNYFKNIILYKKINPGIDPKMFYDVYLDLFNYAKQLRMNVKPVNNKINPLMRFNKLNLFIGKKYIKYVKNPFTENIEISNLWLFIKSIFI